MTIHTYSIDTISNNETSEDDLQNGVIYGPFFGTFLRNSFFNALFPFYRNIIIVSLRRQSRIQIKRIR